MQKNDHVSYAAQERTFWFGGINLCEIKRDVTLDGMKLTEECVYEGTLHSLPSPETQLT